VFAGGFDLQSACAVAGSDGSDEYAILDLLDALVRKSLLTTERSTGRTRFSLLETIRQFAEEQLVARGEAETIRRAHARYFAAREADILGLWDGPRQRETYVWFNVELANLRTAFRWAADTNDLDAAAAIAIYASMFGAQTENYEPIAWAEQLVIPARAVHHPRLASLYAMAVLCYVAGRVEQALQYADAGRLAIDSGEFDDVPHGQEGVLAGPYSIIGQPERAVEWCRAQLAHERDTHGITAGNLVLALMWAGCADEARTVANGLVDATEATDNPWVLSFALFCYGYAFSESEPTRALHALSRGLMAVQGGGCRYNITILAAALSRLESEHGDPFAALEHIRLVIRTYHDSGNSQGMRTAAAILAAHFDRLERYESAATAAGFAIDPLNTAGLPELNIAVAHLREVLGDPTYESLAREGKTMTAAGIATYACDHIDQALIELKAVSK
jgi:hypothetical protein